MIDDFTFIPTGNFDKPLQTGHLICNHCNKRVETGIINVSDHWLNCVDRTEGLIVAKNSWERSILDSMSMNVIVGRESIKSETPQSDTDHGKQAD